MNPAIKEPIFRLNNMKGIPCQRGKQTIDENTPIYKIIKLEYVLSMIQNQELVMNQIIKWDDPFENVFLKQNFKTLIGTTQANVEVDKIREAIYGQSWSLLRESDAMWRIYSMNHDAVRIKTTIGKLFDSIYTSDRCMADTYIGVVTYLTKKDLYAPIKAYQQAGITIPDFEKATIKMSLVKRNNFSHEREVRILKMLSTQDLDDYKAKGIDTSLYKTPINFDSLIDEICLDPFLNLSQTRKQKAQLRSAGVSESKIKKSRLYVSPYKYNIQILN